MCWRGMTWIGRSVHRQQDPGGNDVVIFQRRAPLRTGERVCRCTIRDEGSDSDHSNGLVDTE